MGIPPTPGVKPEVPDYTQQARLQVGGQRKGGYFSDLWAYFWSTVADGFDGLLVAIQEIGQYWLAKLNLLMVRMQGDDTPQFYDLIASVLTDALDLEISAESLKQAKFGKGRSAAYAAIGGELLDTFANDFVTPSARQGVGRSTTNNKDGIGGLPDVKLTPAQGVEAARRFVGWGISQAVQGANTALMGELFTLGQVEQFGKYSDNVARAISLERQSRAALRPLFEVLIATPFEWAMMKQYRPTLLAIGEVLDAIIAGNVAPEDGYEELARRGISTAKINTLLEQRQKRIGLDDVERRVRFGLWTQAEAVDYLRQQGWTVQGAELALENLNLVRVEAHLRGSINELQAAYVDSVLDEAGFRTELGFLNIRGAEADALVHAAAVRQAVPRRRLSQGQLEAAFKDGLITIGEYEAELVKDGYSRDDADLLKIMALLELADEVAAKAARDARAKAKAAKTTGQGGPAGGSTGTPTP